jgi:hypothetical protein
MMICSVAVLMRHHIVRVLKKGDYFQNCFEKKTDVSHIHLIQLPSVWIFSSFFAVSYNTYLAPHTSKFLKKQRRMLRNDDIDRLRAHVDDDDGLAWPACMCSTLSKSDRLLPSSVINHPHPSSINRFAPQ